MIGGPNDRFDGSLLIHYRLSLRRTETRRRRSKAGSLGPTVNGINYTELFIFPMFPARPLSVSEALVYNW
jgi:hypothetical protein